MRRAVANLLGRGALALLLAPASAAASTITEIDASALFGASPLVIVGAPPDSPALHVDPNTTSSPFAGVGSIAVSVPGTGVFLGSGAAISPRHVLTAAHLFDVVGSDGVVDVPPGNVTFLLNFGGNLTHAFTASALTLYPGFTGFGNPSILDDLAIVTLAAPLPPGVPIYDIVRAVPPAPVTLTMVGYGRSGSGTEGFTTGADPSVKRWGRNTLDAFLLDAALSPKGFVFDFDGPTPATNYLGGLTLGNDLEATIGPGDSGGPAFIEVGGAYRIVGVDTFSGNFFLGQPAPPFFGSSAGGMLVPAYAAWIDRVRGVPEPASLALAVAGAAVLAVARRRRPASRRAGSDLDSHRSASCGRNAFRPRRAARCARSHCLPDMLEDRFSKPVSTRHAPRRAHTRRACARAGAGGMPEMRPETRADLRVERVPRFGEKFAKPFPKGAAKEAPLLGEDEVPGGATYPRGGARKGGAQDMHAIGRELRAAFLFGAALAVVMGSRASGLTINADYNLQLTNEVTTSGGMTARAYLQALFLGNTAFLGQDAVGFTPDGSALDGPYASALSKALGPPEPPRYANSFDGSPIDSSMTQAFGSWESQDRQLILEQLAIGDTFFAEDLPPAIATGTHYWDGRGPNEFEFFPIAGETLSGEYVAGQTTLTVSASNGLDPAVFAFYAPYGLGEGSFFQLRLESTLALDELPPLGLMLTDPLGRTYRGETFYSSRGFFGGEFIETVNLYGVDAGPGWYMLTFGLLTADGTIGPLSWTFSYEDPFANNVTVFWSDFRISLEVPEPSTLGLLALGAAAVSFARKRHSARTGIERAR